MLKTEVKTNFKTNHIPRLDVKLIEFSYVSAGNFCMCLEYLYIFLKCHSYNNLIATYCSDITK